MVVGTQARRDRAQELGARRRVQVADGAAEERNDTPAVPRDPIEVVFEVADHGVHVDRCVLFVDRARRLAQRLLADVERHEAFERTRAAHRVEQEPGLLRCARSQLHECVRPCQPRDVDRVRAEDLPFTARRVVLREPRDLVEELGPTVVVEPLGRDVLGR